MPFDKKGKHHLNTQKAMASDKSADTSAPAPDSASGAMLDPQQDAAQDLVTCPHCGAQFVNDPMEQAQSDGSAAPMPEHAQHAPLMSGM